MTAFGLLAGVGLYLLSEVIERGHLQGRAALAAAGFAAIFFGGLLGMTGPMRPLRALAGALAIAAVATGLLLWSSLRFHAVEQMFDSPMPALALMVLAALPVPFVIAADGPGWRDYPALFTQAWGLVVRYAAAWVFVALVWALLMLSDMLLTLVGIRFIGEMVDEAMVPWLITGGTLGLGLAVVQDFDDVVSPFLILRLLRLLLPVVLVVMAVFLVALPLRGMSRGLFGGISATATLLAMIAAGVTLVTSAVDRTDAEAAESPVLQRSAQALALILPLPAVLAAWGIWQRVGQYGWTPERLFLAVVTTLAVVYGLLYAAAVLRGRNWRGAIRQANIAMALAVITAAALWLTPVLNPQAISARSQLARFERGAVDAAALDITALGRWGRAGDAALARLAELAEQPGQQALALRLSDPPAPESRPVADVLADLTAIMPLQPATAGATRDLLLQSLYDHDLRDFLSFCRTPLPESGAPGCVMVVADFWPLQPGEEAVFAGLDSHGYLRLEGLALVDGVLVHPGVRRSEAGGTFADGEGRGLIAALQGNALTLAPAVLNQVWLPDGSGLLLAP